jgi:hypothetical protein
MWALPWKLPYPDPIRKTHYQTKHCVGKNEECGFAVKQRQNNTKTAKVSIPVIRFSTWLEEHVNQRKIPSTPYGSYRNSGPKVVMKLDVEGSE